MPVEHASTISYEFSAELRLRVIHELLRQTIVMEKGSQDETSGVENVTSPGPPVEVGLPAPIGYDSFWKEVAGEDHNSQAEHLLKTSPFASSEKEIRALQRVKGQDKPLEEPDFNRAFVRLIEAVDKSIEPSQMSGSSGFVTSVLTLFGIGGSKKRSEDQAALDKLYEVMASNQGPALLLSRGGAEGGNIKAYEVAHYLCIWCFSHRLSADIQLAKRISIWRFLAITHRLLSNEGSKTLTLNSSDAYVEKHPHVAQPEMFLHVGFSVSDSRVAIGNGSRAPIRVILSQENMASSSMPRVETSGDSSNLSDSEPTHRVPNYPNANGRSTVQREIEKPGESREPHDETTVKGSARKDGEQHSSESADNGRRDQIRVSPEFNLETELSELESENRFSEAEDPDVAPERETNNEGSRLEAKHGDPGSKKHNLAPEIEANDRGHELEVQALEKEQPTADVNARQKALMDWGGSSDRSQKFRKMLQSEKPQGAVEKCAVTAKWLVPKLDRLTKADLTSLCKHLSIPIDGFQRAKVKELLDHVREKLAAGLLEIG